MGVQHVDPAKWRLEVSGLVETPLIFGYAEFMTLPMTSYSKSFHCLLPGSLVYAKPRPLAIEDIRPGMEIVGHDGLNHKVTELVRIPHSGQVIGVKASYLPTVLLTPDHPVWAVRAHPGYGKARSKRRKLTFRQGWRAEWIRGDALKQGDYVFFPKYKFISPEQRVTSQGVTFSIDEKLARLLGWYLAEGSAASSYDRAVAFALNSSEQEHRLEIIELMEDLMGARMGTYLNERGTGMTVVATSSRAGRLRTIFADWCGIGAANKYIPDFIMDAEPKVR